MGVGDRGTNFRLEIDEGGVGVREYRDTNLDRFMSVTKEMIQSHLNTYTSTTYNGDKITKNIQFHIYTY